MISKIEDHEEKGLALLLHQFRNKPRFEALLRILLRQAQELEEVFHDIYLSRLLDDAVGDQLTRLGRLVGERRTYADDDLFRAIIRAKIRAIRSSGTIPDFIELLSMIGYEPEDYTMLVTSMAIVIDITSIHGLSLAKLFHDRLGSKIVAGGVDYQTVYETDGTTPGEGFSFSDGVPDAPFASGNGFSDLVSGTGGQRFAGVFT